MIEFRETGSRTGLLDLKSPSNTLNKKKKPLANAVDAH